ncbi:serine/threonine protein kinase [Geodermatophilus sp. YIM 151500]|uniref:serine/threonine-protein kinase n=1 Tax=Geodermatophilus sp. YIM 151500 TaxID=2984531 RepID=UPI0021E433DC|nr:serine/threonine-protein kinase [Geodermatophilus sp. YIM 151500]MCV2489916.1 serine/threonine protein kinase [Geodermatophilus sp. YIM 151500]
MGLDAGPRGRVIADRYELADVLGRGGMGTVWLATDRVLQRRVALKEVTFSVHLTDEERAVLRERTLREARAAARLDHPCVTTVFDVVEEEGKPWLVMEHVPARSLQRIVEDDGPLSPEAVARIGLDVLAALEAAHAEGIVHRDVKPANVLVVHDGHARLTDFGIATSTGDASLTTSGAFIGSPPYMAPERATGGTPEPPVDLWSLGATLYTAVEGRLAFDRGDAMATLMAVANEDPAPVHRAGPLEPLLRGLLTKEPARRATVAQARRDLEAVLAGARPDAAAGTPAAPPPAAGDQAARPSAAGSSAAGSPGPPPKAPGGPPPPRSDGAPSPDGAAGPPAREQPPAYPPPRPGPVPAGSVHRFDADDLHRLAHASRAVLGSVARGSARYVAERRREHRRPEHRRPEHRRPEPPPPPPARRRFKRRWVVVPTLAALVVTLLVLAAGVALLGWLLGWI